MVDTVRLSAATHVGYHRSINEDRCRTPSWRTDGEDDDWFSSGDRNGAWALIADGMGGHGAGDVASELAVRIIARSLEAMDGRADPELMIEEANQAIHEAMVSGRGHPAMGTTIVGIMLDLTGCTFFNVGDSRAYVLRDGRLTRHSVDHTPPASRQTGARSHALTQSLGGTLIRIRLQPHVERVELAAGDMIILCSDGLTDLVEDEEIAALLRRSPPHPAATLVAAALSAGGRDNITVVVVSI